MRKLLGRLFRPPLLHLEGQKALGEKVLLGVLALGLFLGLAWEEAPKPPPLSPVFLDAKGHLLHVGLSADEKWRLPLPDAALHQLAPLLLHKEDRYFWYHPGFFPPALLRAVWHTLQGRPQGGSTLTMQLARLWRPGRRSVPRKLLEIFWAIGLELRYTKTDILRFYLDYAPFGGNIEGLETAARWYFGKSAVSLTPLELSALLLISQCPSLQKAFLRGEAAFRQRALFWVRRWAQAGLVSPSDLAQAERLPLRPLPRPLPHLPPHTLPSTAASGDTLYLIPTLQARAEALLRQHLAFWRSCGVQEGAILIAEAATGKVLAYVPSSDYFHCAIDLIQIRRSVGSTLKPLLWREALERGLIHSATPLLDAPRFFGRYKPINFERPYYRGQVEAAEALRQSLNAPATFLLHRVGLMEFVQRLQELGLPRPKYLEYNLIVGGVEASLYELVQAYTPLATGGLWVKLRRTPRDSILQKEIGHPGSSWIVREILRLPDGWSYKTGTSTYLRDAWCIAWSPTHIVGVWLGNPDGRASGCLKGRLTALPLAEKVVALLPLPPLDKPPFEVERALSCALTGDRPLPTCPSQKPAYYLRGRYAWKDCQHFRVLWLSPNFTYCSACLPADTAGLRLRRVELPNLPALAAYFQGRRYDLPPHAPSCMQASLDLLSPQPYSTVWLRSYPPYLPLQAVADPPTPVVWGCGRDTLGWQPFGHIRWQIIPSSDSILSLWVQTGQTRLDFRLRLRAPLPK
ncbi:MAG: transglycosylase domain-containing protein [Bacteroidia bacterium]